jgi:hypothetical protein
VAFVVAGASVVAGTVVVARAAVVSGDDGAGAAVTGMGSGGSDGSAGCGTVPRVVVDARVVVGVVVVGGAVVGGVVVGGAVVGGVVGGAVEGAEVTGGSVAGGAVTGGAVEGAGIVGGGAGAPVAGGSVGAGAGAPLDDDWDDEAPVVGERDEPTRAAAVARAVVDGTPMLAAAAVDGATVDDPAPLVDGAFSTAPRTNADGGGEEGCSFGVVRSWLPVSGAPVSPPDVARHTTSPPRAATTAVTTTIDTVRRRVGEEGGSAVAGAASASAWRTVKLRRESASAAAFSPIAMHVLCCTRRSPASPVTMPTPGATGRPHTLHVAGNRFGCGMMPPGSGAAPRRNLVQLTGIVALVVSCCW